MRGGGGRAGGGGGGGGLVLSFVFDEKDIRSLFATHANRIIGLSLIV